MACAAPFTLEEARRKERGFEALEAKITELWGHLNAATYRFLRWSRSSIARKRTNVTGSPTLRSG